MMYGFGDDKNPYTESVDLLEDLVIEFITEMTHRAMEIGRTGRVQVEDIIFLVRKDARKYARVKDLLTMNEELKKARKAFDEIKYVGKNENIWHLNESFPASLPSNEVVTIRFHLQEAKPKSNDTKPSKSWTMDFREFNLPPSRRDLHCPIESLVNQSIVLF